MYFESTAFSDVWLYITGSTCPCTHPPGCEVWHGQHDMFSPEGNELALILARCQVRLPAVAHHQHALSWAQQLALLQQVLADTACGLLQRAATAVPKAILDQAKTCSSWADRDWPYSWITNHRVPQIASPLCSPHPSKQDMFCWRTACAVTLTTLKVPRTCSSQKKKLTAVRVYHTFIVSNARQQTRGRKFFYRPVCQIPAASSCLR